MNMLTLQVQRLREMVKGQLGGLSRWQLALLFGTPVTIGVVGFIYYKSRKHKKDTASARAREKIPEPPLIDQAVEAKKHGNTLFKAGKYTEAIDCYTGAIALCPLDRPDELATFYQNRAAAHDQLGHHEQVLSDCSRALDLNPKYAKALSRRAKSAERLGDFKLALEDLSFLSTLENFANEETVKFSNWVLSQLAKQKAKIEMDSRKPRLPSKTFMSVFREMFRNDPIFNIDISKLNESSPFTKACKQFLDAKCENVIDLCNEELLLPESEYLTEALLLRGTAHFYMSAFEDAITDLDSLVGKPDIDTKVKANALIKKASCYGHQGLSQEALDIYDEAVNVDPENIDVYFHRGQQLMFENQWEESIEDYQKCIEICPDFAHAYVYKCITEHRRALFNNFTEEFENNAAHFREVINKFPNCIEARLRFAQTLLGQKQQKEARKHIEKAVELDKNNAMATVYMGVLLLNYKPDLDQIRYYVEKAIELDDLYEYPYELLGSAEVQTDQINSAISNYQKAIKLARTKHEIAHLYTLMAATQAQIEVTRRLCMDLYNAIGPMPDTVAE